MAWSRNPYYSTPEWHALSRACLNRDRWTCQKCGARANEADHIIPRSQGGTDTLGNLQALCPPCHRAKSSSEGGHALAARRGRTQREPEPHPGLR